MIAPTYTLRSGWSRSGGIGGRWTRAAAGR